MAVKFEHKEWFTFILSLLFIADIAILLDIPFLRQIFGFFFLTILPGLLILQILKLSKIGSSEKFVLSVGLSISFLMFFGLLINNLSLCLGYETPLLTVPLLISFNIAFIVLAVIGYEVNKELSFSLPNLNMSMSEKAFLIVPILFPALSIFGMNLMNTTDNNIVLIFLLFLIPIYIAIVCFFNQEFPKRLYPIVIFLISISLLLMLSLRSNHIIGADTHAEFRLFHATLNNMYWSITAHNALDACLAISLLPAIYQSIISISLEFLFKILYSVIYSVSPLAIYILSKKYVGERCAFLASCFFMSQYNFLWTAANARTNMAILFFALAMMTLFNDKIDSVTKRILFIVFMASCVVSHYTTTYIFFFITLGALIGVEILSKKYTFKKAVSLTIVLIFFALIFFWYSQVTETAFAAGVVFVEKTLNNLNNFFIEESRGAAVQQIFDPGIMKQAIPYKIEFIFRWITFAFIGIGIITLIKKYKETPFTELNIKKPEFLRKKFEVEYSIIALASVGLLVVMVALPYVAVGYDISRSYPIAITTLSVFFVIGGMIFLKYLNQFFVNFLNKASMKPFLSKDRARFMKRCSSFDKSFTKKTSQIRICVVILLVLIPYFLCVTGAMYNIFGVPRAITLNSEGKFYSALYIHDQESHGTRWLCEHIDNPIIYKDAAGFLGLEGVDPTKLPKKIRYLGQEKRIRDGYIYLRYINIVEQKICTTLWCEEPKDIMEYSYQFAGRSKIYDNGGAEIYK